ncbi:unnamed protein product [Anisakis simplex]|uniref:Ribosomal_L7Ae domain-containing protein n=1 Tax=Anisakis simplex TaxID=6269 RepID=A0A0M3JZB8_ANISI|nr:unnamed protein product [Anisakis simplex]
MGRPFLKCGLILDWHIPSKEVSMCFVDELNTLLRNNEYERRLKSPQRMSKNRQDNPDVINDSSLIKAKKNSGLDGVSFCVDSELDLIFFSGLGSILGCRLTRANTHASHWARAEKRGKDTRFPVPPPQYSDMDVIEFQLRIATIGLRSVLRSMQKGVVTMVFLDANLLRPSAVSTVLGLYAISCNAVNVYALEGLDVTISKSLNFRVVGAVGLCENEQTDAICTKAKRELRPVERVCTRTSRMSMPLIAAELNVSCGKQKKSGKKKKKSKLKVNFVTN